MNIEREQVKRIIEAALLCVEQPITVAAMQSLFEDQERPDGKLLAELLTEIDADCADRGYQLQQTASGYRFQVRQELSPWVSRLWAERAPRYSRALLETLALVAYRQPVTRGDIEEIRGVAVSSNIMRTLQEREWVRVVGHRDVPGRPELFATTRQFLDYFNLKNLEDLPRLAEIKDFEQLDPELSLPIDAAMAAGDDVAEPGEATQPGEANEAIEATGLRETGEADVALGEPAGEESALVPDTDTGNTEADAELLTAEGDAGDAEASNGNDSPGLEAAELSSEQSEQQDEEASRPA